MIRRSFIIAGIALAWLAAGAQAPAMAGKAKVYTGLIEGVGAGGYDVVAYQTEGSAKPGETSITAKQDGIAYRFTNTANRDTFLADPEKYLPQFGGYCAWAVASGSTAQADPEAWNVVDGKLYLNYSQPIRARWARDAKVNIAKGEANWPKVLE